jgi:hypothetical protein
LPTKIRSTGPASSAGEDITLRPASQNLDQHKGSSSMTASGQIVKLLNDTIAVDVDFITSQCYLRPNDIVFLAGSLVEGMGNQYSDLDVYVITGELRSSTAIDVGRHHRVFSTDRDIMREGSSPKPVLLIHTVLPNSKIKVDVEFRTYKDLQLLYARISTMFEYACDNLIMLSKRLESREEFIVHRLLTCTPIINGDAISDLLSGLSRSQYAYLSYRWFASDFSILLDLLGVWHQGHAQLAADIAREQVIQEMTGYLCLLGVTNIRRKWLLPYLEKVAIDPALKQRFLDCLFFTDTETQQKKLHYIEKSLDLIDDIFDASRPLLEQLPSVPSGERALSKLRQEVNMDPSGGADYAEMEFDYRSKAYGRRCAPTRSLLPPFGAGAIEWPQA